MRQLRWPLHPHPIQEECILSWLTRIANCYNFSLDELLKIDLGFQGNPDDLNINTPDWLVTLLSKRTGISEQDIYAMTISSLSSFFLDDLELETSDFESYVHHYSVLIPWNRRKKFLPKKSWKPWFSKSWNIVRACPVCVKSGSILLVWSLPIMLTCVVHKCFLRECITNQGRFSYWKNESESLDEPLSFIQTMDQRTWSAIATGQVTLQRRTIHGGVWFRLLRTLIDELHMAPSTLSKIDASIIANVWDTLGLNVRAGQNVWSPYEFLSFEKQRQTLLAAAKSMEQIENRIISPDGEQGNLFLSESFNSEDLLSSCPTRPDPESPWTKFHNAVNDLFEIAKRDPVEAMGLRNFMLFGRKDPESIQKVESILLDGGVPKEFLVT